METGTTARREWSTIFKQLRYDSKMVSIKMVRFELITNQCSYIRICIFESS